jgi:hypothetical protein
VFATVFVLLFVAHMVADYAIQTDHQSARKADRTAEGWRANIGHAFSHVVACTIALAVGAAFLDGVHLPTARAAVAVLWVGTSHAFIDRRWPIAWWMNHTGSGPFYRNGGAQYVDQTAHIVALAVAAVVIGA